MYSIYMKMSEIHQLLTEIGIRNSAHVRIDGNVLSITHQSPSSSSRMSNATIVSF